MKGSGSVSVQIITDTDTGGTKTYGFRSGSGSGTMVQRGFKSYMTKLRDNLTIHQKIYVFCENILPCIELCFDSSKNKRVAFRRNEHWKKAFFLSFNLEGNPNVLLLSFRSAHDSLPPPADYEDSRGWLRLRRRRTTAATDNGGGSRTIYPHMQ